MTGQLTFVGVTVLVKRPFTDAKASMESSDANKLRALKVENGRLKNLLAEQMLDNAILRDVNSKKWQRPRPSRKHWRICVTNIM